MITSSSSVPEDVVQEVRRIIARTLRISIVEVTLDRRLDAAGLGVDSLGLIKLNVALEERFDIVIPEFVAEDPSLVRTVSDVVDLVAGALAVAGAS